MSKERRMRPARAPIRRSNAIMSRRLSAKGQGDDVERVTQLYVGGLDPYVEKKDLRPEFEKFGRLEELWIAQKPPGFAFVRYFFHRDASEAVRNLDGQRVLGCNLRVEFSTTDTSFAPAGNRPLRGRSGAPGRGGARQGIPRLNVRSREPLRIRGLRGRAPVRSARRRTGRRGAIRMQRKNRGGSQEQSQEDLHGREQEHRERSSSVNEQFENKQRSASRSPKPVGMTKPSRLKEKISRRGGAAEGSNAVAAARVKLLRAKEVAVRRKAGLSTAPPARLMNAAQRLRAVRARKIGPVQPAGENKPLPLMNVDVQPSLRAYAPPAPLLSPSQRHDRYSQPTAAPAQTSYGAPISELRNRDGQRFGSKVVRRSDWNMPRGQPASSTTNMSPPRNRSPLQQRSRPALTGGGDSYGHDASLDYGPRYMAGQDYGRGQADPRYDGYVGGRNRSRSPVNRMPQYSHGPGPPARAGPYGSGPIRDDRLEYGPRARPFVGGDRSDSCDGPMYEPHNGRGAYGTTRVSRAGFRGGRGRRDSFGASNMDRPYPPQGYASNDLGHDLLDRYPKNDRGWTPPPPPLPASRLPPQRGRPMSQYSSRADYDPDRSSYSASYRAQSPGPGPAPRSQYMQSPVPGYPSQESAYSSSSQRGYSSPPARGERAAYESSSQYNSSTYYSPPRSSGYQSSPPPASSNRGNHYAGGQYSSSSQDTRAGASTYDGNIGRYPSARSASPTRDDRSYSGYMKQREDYGKGGYASVERGTRQEASHTDAGRRSRSYTPPRKVRHRTPEEKSRTVVRSRRSPSPARSPVQQRNTNTSKYTQNTSKYDSAHSRQPVRQRSRTPVRQKSRSSVDRRSRTPVKRRSRTPERRRSRTPLQQNKVRKSWSRSNSRSRNPKKASAKKRRASYSSERYRSPVHSTKLKSKHKATSQRYASSNKSKKR